MEQNCIKPIENIGFNAVAKAADYIKRNYMRKLTLEEVTAQCFISVSRFSVMFKTFFKCSFNKYLNRVRLENSKELLKDDSLSINAVSFLCGFETNSYFTRLFKKKMGMTPKEYRVKTLSGLQEYHPRNDGKIYIPSMLKHPKIIQKTVKYINDNFAEQVTIQEAALQVYLSPYYFSKIFKSEMNCTFNHFLNRVRVEKSKEFLGDTVLTVSEIGQMVGFHDQSYYSKVFKRIAGISPNDYREMIAAKKKGHACM